MPYKNPEEAAAAKRRHYDKNKDLFKERARSRVRKIKEEIRTIKEASPCTDCKVKYPYYVMHFDHLGIEEKLERVSELIRSRGYDTVMAELEKCELVCANCHAIRTWQRLQ
jgi:hypothetical protein